MEQKRNVLVILIVVLLLLLLLIFIGSNISNSKSGSDNDGKDASGSGDGSGSDESGNSEDGTAEGDKEGMLPGQEGLLPGSLGSNLTEDQKVIAGLEFYKYTGLQAAEKIESFLRSMRKQDGLYYFSETCAEEKSGPEQVQNNNWAIMSYSSLYDETKKEIYKSRLLSDWEISAADKTSADLYTSFQLYQLYLLSGKYPALLSDIDKDGLFKKINSVGSSIITGYEPREDYSMIIATLSRASFISSMLLNEKATDSSPEIFNNAELLLNKADEKEEIMLLEKNDEELKEGSCWVELAKLQKFEITKETSILEDSKSYFDSLKLREEFDTPKLLDSSIPMNLLPCAEALLILNEKTGNIDYLEDARAVLLAYLKFNWDLPERKFCSGDNGMLAKRKTSEESGRKIVTDNAYFIYLFSKSNINDYEFKWLK